MTKRITGKKNWLWMLLLLVFGVAYLYFSEPLTETVVPPPTQEVKGSTTKTPTTSVNNSPTGEIFELYFTSPYYPGEIDKHLIEKIDNAKVSIDLAVYELNIESVAQALINADSRGVEVRVVYDSKQIADTVQVPELINAGISAIPDNRSAFMHNKFFVFDGQCVWTGSFNVSMNAANKNFENAVYFCSKEAVENYDAEFFEMYSGKFGSTSPSDTPNPTFYLNGILIKNYFGPEDQVMEKVISTVSQAKSSIHFMTFSFTYDDLADEMVNRANSGVQIEGIFESTGANTDSSECNTLLNEGYDIRLDDVGGSTFHHKVIIVDSQIVIFGSFNFSANANENNDENLLIVYDQNLAMRFEKEYQAMKQQAVVPSGSDCSK